MQAGYAGSCVRKSDDRKSARGIDLAQQDRRDEESGDNEENIDAQESTAKQHRTASAGCDFEMINKYADHRDRTQTIDLGPILDCH